MALKRSGVRIPSSPPKFYALSLPALSRWVRLWGAFAFYPGWFELKKINPGSVLTSRAVASPLLSPLEGLTAVFGMGTGVSPPLWPPGLILETLTGDSVKNLHSWSARLEALDLLVALISTRYRAYNCALSTR
jgi:hypothetical protein